MQAQKRTPIKQRRQPRSKMAVFLTEITFFFQGGFFSVRCRVFDMELKFACSSSEIESLFLFSLFRGHSKGCRGFIWSSISYLVPLARLH